MNVREEKSVDKSIDARKEVIAKLEKVFENAEAIELGAALAWIQHRMVTSGLSKCEHEANLAIFQCVYDPEHTGGILAQMCQMCVTKKLYVDAEAAAVAMAAVLLTVPGGHLFERLQKILAIMEKLDGKRCGIVIKRAE